MKNHLLIFCLLVIMSGCSKDNSVTPQGKNYRDANGTYVNLTTTQWYVTKNGNFATLYLKIAGSTNGDKLTITTYGDGVVQDVNIQLEPNKSFNKDIGVAFTAAGGSSGSFDTSTKIVTYKGGDSFTTVLSSGKLDY